MTGVALGTWAFGPLATGPQMVLPEVFERTALLGFDGVELGAFGSHGTPETWSTAGARDQLRAAIARRELGLAGVITFARSSIVRDPVPNEYLAYFDTSLRFCVDLGATTLVVHTVDPPEIVEEIGHRTALDRLVHTWAECAQRAHAVGVTLAWEFEAGSAFNTAEDVVEIANALAMPGFGVLYDTVHAHMACGGEREPTDDAQIEFFLGNSEATYRSCTRCRHRRHANRGRCGADRLRLRWRPLYNNPCPSWQRGDQLRASPPGCDGGGRPTALGLC